MDSPNGGPQVEGTPEASQDNREPPTTAQRWMNALFRASIAGFISMVFIVNALPPKPDAVGAHPLHFFVYGLAGGMVVFSGYKGWNEAKGTPRSAP